MGKFVLTFICLNWISFLEICVERDGQNSRSRNKTFFYLFLFFSKELEDYCALLETYPQRARRIIKSKMKTEKKSFKSNKMTCSNDPHKIFHLASCGIRKEREDQNRKKAKRKSWSHLTIFELAKNTGLD